MIYGSWNIRCNRQNFLSFWAIFCPFCPLTTQKITTLKLKKNKKHLEIFNENDNHMMYGCWDMEPDRQNFLSFWTVFYHLLPHGPRKSKFWKNEKNIWRYYHFTNVYQKWQSYDVWFLRYGVQQTEVFVILEHFLSFLPS